MLRLLLLLALAAAPARAEGGMLRLLARSSAGSIDPHINYTAQFWQVFAGVYDGLVAFRKTEGPAGLDIVPDLASDILRPDDLTFRFPMRPGLRFSNGAPVRAEDVVASFRRIFRVGSPTSATFYGAIEGAPACLRSPADCALAGVSADGDVITVRLAHPDPEFLQKLALPHASVLPADAPPRDAGTRPLPGTGPWRIAGYDPDRRLTLERNPFFQVWNADAQPPALADGVIYRFGLEPEAQVTAVLNGQADWMFDTPPPDRLAGLPPARVHLNAAAALWFVPLNVNLPPFDRPAVRRAFNMAIDRRAGVRLFGGSALAVPLCGAIPPGLAGHAPYCPYGHDLAAARRLVQESGAAGTPVTLVVDDSAVARLLGAWLIQALSDIGLPARLQTLSGKIQFTHIQNTANRVQASLTSWYADYPSAANIIAGNFGCDAFRPNSDSSTNIAGFCDPALDARLAAALRTHDTDALAAVDRALTDAAPAVMLFAPRYIDLTGPQLRGFRYHPTFRWLMQRSSVQ